MKQHTPDKIKCIPLKTDQKMRTKTSATKSFFIEMMVDGVPYEIKGQIFGFNEEKRVRISINGGDQHIYTWDPIQLA
ncbi:MAG TPA: hypothetical protein VHN59_01120 [Chitinophagaceae bacterium]|nr:hypothetical protein [Chitinophagaceae bacterium]